MSTTASAPVGATPARKRVRLTPEDRRDQIVREATRLIAQSGFNAVTLAAIADACGIRKPSVLHYFPTMLHLLRAVLEQRDIQDFVEQGSVLPEPNPQATREFFTRIVEHNMRQREVVRLYAVLGAEALDPDHPAHAYFVERSRQSRVALRELLRWTADPDAAATELLAIWQGLELEWLRDPELDFLAVWHQFCDRFFA